MSFQKTFLWNGSKNVSAFHWNHLTGDGLGETSTTPTFPYLLVIQQAACPKSSTKDLLDSLLMTNDENCAFHNSRSNFYMKRQLLDQECWMSIQLSFLLSWNVQWLGRETIWRRDDLKTDLSNIFERYQQIAYKPQHVVETDVVGLHRHSLKMFAAFDFVKKRSFYKL